MAAQTLEPAPQEKRLAAYLDWLAQAAGHADRNLPLRNYYTGLLLDGQRKSVEPMAARLAPDHGQSRHESLHRFVAQSPWSDADRLRQVRNYVLPAMQKNGPATAWIVDETGFVKKGTHSVGVARQYGGRVGKKENCQAAVSLSVATATGSLPIAWRLYLPEEWVSDPERRSKTDVPSIAAYGFLMAERSRFFPSAHVGHLGLRPAPIPPHFRPRGVKGSRPTP